jgi:DNA-binding SARP family transcriptional activator
VLALLPLEANRVVSMDRLADDVWSGNPPEGWVTSLQTYVFHVRRALEPDRAPGAAGDVLVTMGRGYLLRVDRDHLDVARFQDGFTAGRVALDAGRYAEAAETLRQALVGVGAVHLRARWAAGGAAGLTRNRKDATGFVDGRIAVQ